MKKSSGGGPAKKTPSDAVQDFSENDPQGSLMSMMKNLYQTGDDDMKRTIAESFAKANNGQGGGMPGGGLGGAAQQMPPPL